jgi:hypothetical protein
MTQVNTMAVGDPFGKTERRDAWWIEPMITGGGLGAFGIYATWVALQNAHFEWGPYLSPFYSPYLVFPGMPSWLSPALLILPFPLLFRATCYYYRKAYYRAYFMDPPACAVGKPLPSGSLVDWTDLVGVVLRKMTGRPLPPDKYKGETAFPFILQNFHRYFLYAAIIFIVILWYDALMAFNFNGHLGMGLGTLIMVINCVLLSLYTFSCHSWRHLMGGKLDCFSCSKLNQGRYKIWSRITHINEHHMRWAWMSLCSVGLTDLYIRLVSTGVIHDLRLF